MNPSTGELIIEEADIVDEFANESEVPRGVRVVKNMRDKLSADRIQAMNREATGILEFRIKEKVQNPWQALTEVIWEYQFIFAGSDKSKPGELEGRWIDFADDFTYTYGYFQDTQGKGRYHYTPADQTILLVDDNSKIKPNEYKIIMATNIMILQGTSIYADNNYQCKVKGRIDLPQKS